MLVSLLFVVSACSGNTNSNQTGSLTANKDTQNNNAQGGPRGRMPDFGQPKRPADVRGVVKSVTGNEVAILKMDINSGAGGRRASSSPDNAGSNSNENNKNTPSISLSGNGGGTRNGGGRMMVGAGGPGGEQSATSRATMLEELKKMSTGEDKVIIPVGIQMLKSSTNTETNKREMVEANLEDISADKMITIWLNASVTDKKVAEFILIN